MSLTEVEHVGYDRSSDYVDNSDLMDRVVSQGDAETEDNRQWGDEPGVGLGLPGLASLTLPSENMVVPPLNFARVRSVCLGSFHKFEITTAALTASNTFPMAIALLILV